MIYLNNAATSHPKPDSVYRKLGMFLQEVGDTPGRGSGGQDQSADACIETARREIGEFFGVPDPARVIFTLNGSDALNTAIRGCVRPGDHVVITRLEHNSVLRNIAALEDECGVTVTRVAPTDTGAVDLDEIAERVTERTRLVAVVHVSNVTGCIQPVREIGRRLRACKGPPPYFLVDAAQSAGVLPLDMEQDGIDLIACPGHKGLLGPPGTGLLLLGPHVVDWIRPVREGGTGGWSDLRRQPEHLPTRLETGSPNTVGIVALLEGVRYVQQKGLDAIEKHERAIAAQIIQGVRKLPGVRILGGEDIQRRVGVVSLAVDGRDSEQLELKLAAEFGIATRGGLHCAPDTHRHYGTIRGGAWRFSAGPFNTHDDAQRAVEAVHKIFGV